LLDTDLSISNQQDVDRMTAAAEPEDADEPTTMAAATGDAVIGCVAAMDFGGLVSAMRCK
jgi:hypothetical protein